VADKTTTVKFIKICNLHNGFIFIEQGKDFDKSIYFIDGTLIDSVEARCIGSKTFS